MSIEEKISQVVFCFWSRMLQKITIAIDGGAGTGKWTTAKWVASALWYAYVDTWAMYRAATIRLDDEGLLRASNEEITKKVDTLRITFWSGDQEWKVFLWEKDVTMQIRSPKTNEHVARISAHMCLRKHLRAQQRVLTKQWWVVMDGRDMWSVVVPHAELKVFLHCSFDERARRRWLDMEAKWVEISLEMIKKNLQERDEIDYTGTTPTSKKATDARELDTTNLTIDEQIVIVVWRAKEILSNNEK